MKIQATRTIQPYASPLLTLALAACVLLAMLAAGCSGSQDGTGLIASPSSLDEVKSSYKGEVLVLLLGRDGCPGTAKATAAADAYAAAKPPHVAMVRLDVPLPSEQLRPCGPWNHAFPRMVDRDRRVAGELGFFFYPTVYVFDRDGDLRYTGGFDQTGMSAMVNEILTEAPRSPKKIYTLPMPAAGEASPTFSGRLLSGQDTSLDALRGERGTLLVFAKTACPFTVQALPSFKALADRYRGRGVTVAIVNNGESGKALHAAYDKAAAGVPVVWDQAGKISAAYGVDVTPFFFLLDAQGKIVSRRSYTPPAATGAVSAMLGLGKETPRFKPTEAG